MGENGDIGAQAFLAKAYFNGTIKAEEGNAGKAFAWAVKAAKNGHADSQVLAGRCCRFGIGTAPNDREAFSWYQKAAAQDNEQGLLYLADAYQTGAGTPRDYKKAFDCYYKAAVQKNSGKAMYQLGLCYEKGWGVPKNDTLTRKWYRAACEAGEERAKAEELFQSGIRYAEENGFPDAARRMKEEKEAINRSLCVLTCGEARRGKSSLLGALLEDTELFPTDIAVTTCLVTMVRYGEKEEIMVLFNDDSTKEISRKEIEEYVMEKKNSGNEKQAKMLFISTPNPKLSDGLIFIDTPGVGSLNPEHSIATLECLTKADVILFVSDCQKPLTETEIEFLKQVKKYSSNLLFVLTKKDLCADPADCEKIMKENKGKIHQAIGLPTERIPYVAVSSVLKIQAASKENPVLAKRQQKSSNFAKFENTLWTLLAQNRGKILFLPPLKKLALELQEIDKTLGIRLVGIGGDKELKEKLGKELQELAASQQEFSSHDAAWRKKIRKKISELNLEISGKISAYQMKMTGQLDEALSSPANRKAPEIVLNTVISLTAMEAGSIENSITEALSSIYREFDKEMDMNVSKELIPVEVAVNENPDITFEKMNRMDQIVNLGREFGGDSYGMRNVGFLAGGIVGGIVGFVIGGGPMGALAHASVGSAGASSLCGAVGTARGAYRAIRNNGAYNIPQIRSEIMKYISQTVMEWKTSLPKYLSDVSYALEDHLEEAIQKRLEKFRRQKQLLEDGAKMSLKEMQQEKEKVLKIRKEGMELFQQVGAFAAELPGKSRPVVRKEEKREADRYSELDD